MAKPSRSSFQETLRSAFAPREFRALRRDSLRLPSSAKAGDADGNRRRVSAPDTSTHLAFHRQRLDGRAGQVTARVPLGNIVSVTTVTNSQASGCQPIHWETEPRTVGPIVGADGFGYLLVSHKTTATHLSCGSGWVNGLYTGWQTVTSTTGDAGMKLLRLARSGQVGEEILDQRDCTESACLEPRPIQLVPDGIGRLLIVAEWWVATPTWNLERRVTRIDHEGERVDTTISRGTRIELVGYDGKRMRLASPETCVSVGRDLRKTSYPKLRTNLGPQPPKHGVKRGFGRHQKAGRVNNIDNPAESAKPPSPVQIRAAPPTSSFVNKHFWGRPASRLSGQGLSRAYGPKLFPR